MAASEWFAARPTATICSDECRSVAYTKPPPLPVLYRDPPSASWLPARHPARRSVPRRSEWWKVLVSGPCAWCSESFTGKAASFETRPLYCSKRCAAAFNDAKRGRFRITDADRLAIYERDGWTCQLCFDPVDPDLPPSDPWAATLDHIECQSWVLVPDHSPSNLRLAHRWCNSVRGDESHHHAEVLAPPAA